MRSVSVCLCKTNAISTVTMEARNILIRDEIFRYVILIPNELTAVNRNVSRVSIGKPEGKRSAGRPRRRLEDNIETGFKFDVSL